MDASAPLLAGPVDIPSVDRLLNAEPLQPLLARYGRSR